VVDRLPLLPALAASRRLEAHPRPRAQAAARGRGTGSSPSAVLLDLQSIKSTERGGEKGYDAGKNVNGRKRHILVDTLGLIVTFLIVLLGLEMISPALRGTTAAT
jgi:hypothetical protein